MTKRITVHGQLTWDPVRGGRALSAPLVPYLIGTTDPATATPLPAYGPVGESLTTVVTTPDGFLPETQFDVPDNEVGVLLVGGGYRTIVFSEQAILDWVQAVLTQIIGVRADVNARLAQIEQERAAMQAEYALFRQQVEEQIANLEDPFASYSGTPGHLLRVDPDGTGIDTIDPATIGGDPGTGTGVDRQAVINIINEVGLESAKVRIDPAIAGLTGITNTRAAIVELVKRVAALNVQASGGIEFYLWDPVAQGWTQDGAPANPADAPTGTWLRVFINHARPETTIAGVEDFDFYAVTTP